MIHFERWGGRLNTVDEWLSPAMAQNPGYRVIKFLENSLDKDFQQYILNHTMVNILCLEKEFNGFTDHRQVIIWKKDGEEVCRSENAKHTVTPKFKQLIVDKINELY